MRKSYDQSFCSVYSGEVYVVEHVLQNEVATIWKVYCMFVDAETVCELNSTWKRVN